MEGEESQDEDKRVFVIPSGMDYDEPREEKKEEEGEEDEEEEQEDETFLFPKDDWASEDYREDLWHLRKAGLDKRLQTTVQGWAERCAVGSGRAGSDRVGSGRVALDGGQGTAS